MLRIDETVRAETLELLQSLVRIKSANPPGDEDEIAAAVKEFLAKNGIAAELVPLEEGRSSVVGRISGRELGSIVLCGHMGTVNVDKGKWSTPPYKPRIVGKRMYGRGTADMKEIGTLSVHLWGPWSLDWQMRWPLSLGFKVIPHEFLIAIPYILTIAARLQEDGSTCKRFWENHTSRNAASHFGRRSKNY